MKPWAQRGYAVLAFSARGFGESCGSAASRLADPVGCAQGWVRLDDVRYEARDIQQLAGLLADAGVVDGQKVGVTGGSYGGGVSLDLAVLRDRVDAARRQPGAVDLARRAADADRRRGARGSRGATSPTRWRPTGARSTTRSRRRPPTSSPSGSPSSPSSPASTPRARPAGYYAPPGADPDADLTALVRRDQRRRALRRPGARHRRRARRPPLRLLPRPLARARADLIANGWTDDLFPVDEALRYYNRTRAQYPGAPLALMFLDFGHQRGQNKDADVARFEQRAYAWMDRYVKGDASAPALQGVEALTADLPQDRALRRALRRADVAGAASRRGPLRERGGADRRSRPAATPRWRAPSTRSPATARARRRAPPTSRAPRPTGCRRRPARATRCSARRRSSPT